MLARLAFALLTSASFVEAQIPGAFGYGCYNPGVRRCACSADRCNSDLCSGLGFFWIEPSPDADPNQPTGGCSEETRCDLDDQCFFDPPTESPVAEPTESPVAEPTESPVAEPTEPPEFGYGCYNPGLRQCACSPDRCNKDLCEGLDLIWIEPASDADPNQPSNGCGADSRCEDDEQCYLTPTAEPTEAPDVCAQYTNCNKCLKNKANNKKCSLYTIGQTNVCISRSKCGSAEYPLGIGPDEGVCYKKNDVLKNKVKRNKFCQKIKKGRLPFTEAPTTSPATPEFLGCFDFITSSCSCASDRCDEEKCTGLGKIWTDCSGLDEDCTCD